MAVFEDEASPLGFQGHDVELVQENGTTVPFLAGTGVYRVSGLDVTSVPELPAASQEPRLLAPILQAGAVVIRYTVGEGGEQPLDLAIFDVQGRRVRALGLGTRTPGPYKEIWRLDDDAGTQVADGVYFLRLEVGGHRLSQKLPVFRR